MWGRRLLSNKRGYIDPGTGGYLLSSIWGWVVSIFTVVVAFTVHFFKFRLRTLWSKLPKKYKLAIIIAPILFVIGILVFRSSEYELPDYDPDIVDVTTNTAQAYDGYTLVEGKLIDMDGEVVHEWPYGYLGVIDDNGDLYAQQEYESKIWGKYSWNGSVIWEKEMPIHHEILLTQDRVIVLTKKVHEYNGRDVEFDVIVEFDKDGRFMKRWSTWERLGDLQQYHKKLDLDEPQSKKIKDAWKNTSIWGGNYDYYHTNAVSLVPNNTRQGRHPAFKPGNYLISFRHGSMVFIIDKDTGDVVWRAIYDQVKDNLEGPHAPQMLENGNILIYDNGRYRGWTRLVVIDPVSLNVTWEYKDDSFFSYSQGYVQVLPNDNMLITESEEGHVFEINSDNEIVWEWWHPEMYDDPALENYGKRHDIYRVTRYDKAFIDELL